MHTRRRTLIAMLVSASSGLYAGLGAAAALGLAAGGCIYAAKWPGSQIFGRALVAPPVPGELALTFDDGPNPSWTPLLMDILALSQRKALPELLAPSSSTRLVFRQWHSVIWVAWALALAVVAAKLRRSWPELNASYRAWRARRAA